MIQLTKMTRGLYSIYPIRLSLVDWLM